MKKVGLTLQSYLILNVHANRLTQNERGEVLWVHDMCNNVDAPNPKEVQGRNEHR